MKEDKDNFFAAVDKAKQRLAAGESPEVVFDWCGEFYKGFMWVILNGKRNFIGYNGNLLSDVWFDYCYSFHDGFARVQLNDKYNHIDHNGNFLSDTWFDDCSFFHEGFAKVRLNGKYNYINHDGKLLSDTWFDTCDDFREGFAWVELDGRYYYLRNNGVLCYCDTKEPIQNIGDKQSDDDLNKSAQEYSFMIPTQCEADSLWKRETEQHFKDGAIWGKERAIKKACECLWNIFQDDDCGIPMFDDGIKELIKTFKKAMEE